ncbi:claspin [Musca autumnalis]|uniref:claspin n=1 Tax=Musca autumnalis TaxID=221902 RepID=UPI003CEE5804
MDEQNTSMEALKVDEDENLKETSMEEDLLGAQSLLLSDSEEEEGDAGVKKYRSPLKKISPNEKLNSNRTKRIIDSDDEQQPIENSENKSNGLEESDEEDRPPVARKKISALIDSESEAEEREPTDNNRNRLKLVDSESEHDSVENENSDQKKKAQKKTNKKVKKVKDSVESKIKKKSKKKNQSGSEDESENYDKKSKKKISNLVDSDSEVENSINSGNDSEMDLDASARACNFEENNNEEDPSNKRKDKNKKAIRASAKKAMDEMQAIQSEQQRLHREASISIPYHKPKKHTLQDFLNRRTIIKPEAQNSSPIVEAVRSKNLKMTQEELEQYAKLMEERAKEATEFFKSESESEEEEMEFKDNDGVLDRPMEKELIEDGSSSKTNANNIQESTVQITEHALEEEKENMEEPLQLTEEEMAEILAAEEEQQKHQESTATDEQTESPSTSKVLITEVIELPKLDMNTVKISPVKKPPLPKTPRNSLNIKQILATKKLKDSPSLSGDPNKLIDLETGDLVERKPTGVENLMQRLMCNTKGRKSKTNETCNILSTDNGKIEITKVNVTLTDEKDPNTKEPKPRAAYFELKKNLKEIIKNKRLQELHKKQEDEAEHAKCLEEDDDEEMDQEEYEPESKPKKKDNVIEIDDEENPVEPGEDEEDDEEENDDEDETDSKLEVKDEIEIDDEENPVDNDAEEEEEDDELEEGNDDDDEDDDSDGDELTETNSNNKSKRNRIIKKFDDSDEDNDDIDFLKTQPPQTPIKLLDTQASIKPAEDEENELLGLCSGTFDMTQNPPTANALMSQIPLTQNQGKPLDDEELMELCSGTFEETVEPTLQTQEKESNIVENTQPQPKCNKILSSDEEDEEKTKAPRTKKLTKKLKKKTAKLGFSDDEEDEEEQTAQDGASDEEDNEEEEAGLEEDEPATFVDYDSEENEIVVQMTKKDCLKKAANFLEKEAELSESEWGSADEDEKNMDKYDIELGDEDEFDREKLRSELEQIHARKMLDDDLREVRKIQDMLFEDEEKDGVGRQRQFKWKNAESGFSLDDGPRDENGDVNNAGDSGDELNEHQWRKIRYEREQFLKEKGLKADSQDLSTTITNTTLNATVNTTILNNTVTTKKIQIITAKKTSVKSADSKTATPFLISKGIAAMNKKTVRGSFLVRDKDTLNKLAGLTKGSAAMANATDDDTAGTVSIKSIKPKNFVFATLTEEEHENMKRKADDLLNSSNENGTNFMKKPKIEPRRDKCFIDQLL